MISVITPCLNVCKDGRADYFVKMMQSVHRQSHHDLEHIVIDGGSTDETLDFLKRYEARGFITRLVSEKGSGIYNAMNKGIGLSRGDFINIMNTDDHFLDDDYFRKCVMILEDDGIDFTHADRVVKSRTGKPDYVKTGDERVAFFRMPFRHQTMIVRRGVFEDVGLFDADYEIAADYKFVLQMLLAGKKGHHIPQTVLCSLDGGTSSNREKCIEEVSRVLYECYGKDSDLSLADCRTIYLRGITPYLYSKILLNVEDQRIVDSLTFCYQQG